MVDDYLIRATALEGKVRVFAVLTTKLIEELRTRHEAYPTATAALGRAASIGAMMGAMLKGEERLTLQIKGNGPLGQIVVDANAHGEVRGYMDHPQVDLEPNSIGKFDVAGAVGTEGFIYVIKDLGMREPYKGSVPIISGELGEDFTHYFAKSEQTPSAVSVGVLINPDETVRASGGLIIQLLPGIDEEQIAVLEDKLSALPPLTTLLDEGLSLEDILHRLVKKVEVSDRLNIRFRCSCSRERVEQMLISLGAEEIRELIDKDEQTEVICHFCNEKYHFDRGEMEAILAKI
ncbi:Hsp33 family molecular chaperone HslO [Ferviditalea candida]|uniref:33 kDa chaperonin n=1 Tax=Ferviditalea candida TaxID=3108399 RepID=A0ABU5ZPG0_9BACL|nr:Hsp33 family molecular chaperone HslO [Paenibacillaceae bacterium T2]